MGKDACYIKTRKILIGSSKLSYHQLKVNIQVDKYTEGALVVSTPCISSAA